MNEAKQIWALLAALAAGAFGCNDATPTMVDAGTDAGADGDADTDSDADSDTDDYDDNIIEGGGTTGGPIDGLLALWFFDDHSGEPIAGVRVMIGDDSANALIGESDAGGRVVFEDPALQGPQNVHHLAEGYPAASIFGFDATFATFTPEEASWAPSASTATVDGAVAGMELIPEPGPGQVKLAIVYFGLSAEDGYSGEYPVIEPELVGDVPANAVIPALGKTSYSLELYERVGTLFAVGGIRNPAAQTFEATHLGILPGFDPGEVDGDVDLTLTVPLVNSFEVQVDPLDGGYGALRAAVNLDLGDDGTVTWSGNLTDGSVATVATPDLSTGPLADAAIMIVASALQPYDPDAAEWETFPQGRRLVRDLSDLDDNIGAPLLVDDLIEAPTGLVWSSDELAVSWPAAASYARVELSDTDGIDVWSGHLFDGALDPVAVPELPADWGWEGIPVGFEVRVNAAVVDADPNDMAFGDFPYLMETSVDGMLLVD